MPELTTKASPLVLYGSLGLALFFLLVVAVLAHINRGSDEVFDIVRPMVLAILLAAAYLTTTVLLAPPIKQESKTQVMIYRKQERVLISFITAVRSISHTASEAMLLQAFRDWEAGVRASGDLAAFQRSTDLREEAELFLDVLEVAFFEWLRFEYGGHWDVVPVSSSGLSSAIRKNVARPDAAERLSGIPVEALEGLLRRNRLVQSGAAFGRLLKPDEVRAIHRGRVWMVPEGSHLNVTRAPITRTLHLTGPYSKLQIDLRHLWNMEKIGGTPLSDRLAEKLQLTAEEKEQALGHVYEVVFTQERPRFKRWAPQAIRQAAWASDMAKRFSADFGWDGILQDLENAVRP